MDDAIVGSFPYAQTWIFNGSWLSYPPIYILPHVPQASVGCTKKSVGKLINYHTRFSRKPRESKLQASN